MPKKLLRRLLASTGLEMAADDEERSVEHPQEPAEGAEEAEGAPGAERAEDDR